VDLYAAYLGPTRLAGASDRLRRDGVPRLYASRPFSQLARSAAWHIGLAVAGIVDHFESLQVLRRKQGAVLQNCRHHREVARCHDSDAPRAGRCVNLGVVGLRKS